MVFISGNWRIMSIFDITVSWLIVHGLHSSLSECIIKFRFTMLWSCASQQLIGAFLCLSLILPGGGLHGVPASEGMCGSGSGHWSQHWEPSREPDTQHGDGSGGHPALCTSGTYY